MLGSGFCYLSIERLGTEAPTSAMGRKRTLGVGLTTTGTTIGKLLCLPSEKRCLDRTTDDGEGEGLSCLVNVIGPPFWCHCEVTRRDALRIPGERLDAA